MTVDQQLRESLQRRAQSVDPSADGWAAITRRIERRQVRTRSVSLSLVGGLSFAAVALVVVMTTFGGPTAQDVAATGGNDPAARSSTTLPSTFGDSPADGPSPTVVAGPSAAPGSGLTPGGLPSAPGASGPSAETTRNFTPEAVWPETLAELEALQAAVDKGQQPWRNDPGAVLSAYFAARGLPTPTFEPPAAGGDVQIRYNAGTSGRVQLSRLLDGSIYYVTSARSDGIPEIHVVRQGDQLAVDVIPSFSGDLVVRTKRPGADWNASARRTVVQGQPVALTVDGPASSALIVQVRLDDTGGLVSQSEQYLGAGILGFDLEDLHPATTVRFGGLGMFTLGMTLAEAERAIGVPVFTEVGEHCTSLLVMGGGGGVTLLSTRGQDRVDLIIVNDKGPRTEAGIGHGSTLAEVLAAYPDIEQRVTDGRGRLVLRPSDPELAAFEMVFEISDGTVAEIWSGYKDLGNTDELCA